jgi:large subunit ribosomal protein L29
MKIKELEDKTEQELIVFVVDLKHKLRGLRFDLKLGKLQNTSLLEQTRKQIARAETVLKAKHGKKI